MKKELLLAQELKAFSDGGFDIEAYTQEVHVLNQEYIQDAIQAVCQDKLEELGDMVKDYRKMRKAIAGLPKSQHQVFFYECGIFNGAYKILEELNRIHMEQADHRSLSKVLERKHVPDIFIYLYKNPDARQGEIAKDINVSPNHLSEILNPLLKMGYVERYGEYKGTRYRLTKAGRLYSRISIMSKETVSDYVVDVDYKEIEDKEKFLMEKINYCGMSGLEKEDEYAKWGKGFRVGSKIVEYRRTMGDFCFERARRM